MIGPNAKLFLAYVEKYRLADRYPEVASMVKQIEMGLISEQVAKICLGRIQPLIEEQIRCFNPLPKAPTQEELGKYDIEFGTLIEDPGVRVGSNETRKVSHSMTAGVTGSGKSNLLRKKIYELSRLKRNLDSSSQDDNSF